MSDKTEPKKPSHTYGAAALGGLLAERGPALPEPSQMDLYRLRLACSKLHHALQADVALLVERRRARLAAATGGGR